jgi:hypothetical protein
MGNSESGPLIPKHEIVVTDFKNLRSNQTAETAKRTATFDRMNSPSSCVSKTNSINDCQQVAE